MHALRVQLSEVPLVGMLARRKMGVDGLGADGGAAVAAAAVLLLAAGALLAGGAPPPPPAPAFLAALAASFSAFLASFFRSFLEGPFFSTSSLLMV